MNADRYSTDASIIEAVKKQLREHSHLQLQRLWCEREDEKLILRGQVPSFFYKQLAQEAVMGLEGVSQIVNEIEVVW